MTEKDCFALSASLLRGAERQDKCRDDLAVRAGKESDKTKDSRIFTEIHEFNWRNRSLFWGGVFLAILQAFVT